MARTRSTSPPPSEAEVTLARQTSRLLASHTEDSVPLRISVQGETVDLPVSAVRLLVRMLEEMAKGNAVTVVPVHPEITTQEAADLLNISRPSLIQLLEDGRILHRLVGTHRRVRLDSLISVKRQLEADRRSALAELAAYDQELGI